MKKERQQGVKKTIRKTYSKIALQENNNESGSSSYSCCVPGCCSGENSSVQVKAIK